MRIAIASSGLGHVARGIETWALDTAMALRDCGVDVGLFSGAEVAGMESTAVPCARRRDAAARMLSAIMPGFTWRWGLKSPYGWEQLSFWRNLEPMLKEGKYDIMHVQDPMLAFWCRRARMRGDLVTKEVLAHGTEEAPEFLAQFDYVQHLAPWHLEQMSEVSGQRSAGELANRHWVAIPNFVDLERFRPATAEQREEARERYGVPQAAHVIGAVSAVKRTHKRIDYLIGAFEEALGMGLDAYLLIAGATTDETASVLDLARKSEGGRVKVLLDLPVHEMPRVYHAMDVLVNSSLFEMMPISLLEAMSSGLPCITNDHPVMEWMTGDGGKRIDMRQRVELSSAFSSLSPEWVRGASRCARKHAEEHFSKGHVIQEYLEYYRTVIQ